MHKFIVKCAKPCFETLGQSKNIKEAKDLILEHYEKETKEELNSVDRIVCTVSLMIRHEAELGNYHYILEQQ